MKINLFLALAIFLRIMVNPLANVFQKQLSSKAIHPLFVNFLTYFLLSIFCVFLACYIPWVNLSNDFWLYSVLGGIVGTLGNGFLIKALQKGDLSVLGPINAYKSVVGIIFGILLLSEYPNIWGILGIAMVIYGSYFVLVTTTERFTFALLKNSEIKFRIWAMILTAIEAVFVKKVILASSTEIAFISWCTFGCFFSFLLLLFSNINPKTEFKKLCKADLNKIFMLVICVGTMQFTTNYAFKHLPVAYVLSLFQLSVIISVWFGYKIFNESDIKKKMLGSIIMLLGSVLIILMK